MKNMPAIQTKAVCVLLTAGLAAVPGCGSGDALGLEDYQRDLLVGLLSGFNLLGGGPGALAGALLGGGQAGPPGLACWDLNGNGVGDPEEDVNGDGLFDALDCQGPQGPQGPEGAAGAPAPGTPGEPGQAGSPGLACWDLNGNSLEDPEEDVNGDGLFDALDCQGPAGPEGPQGNPGPPGGSGRPGPQGPAGPTFFDVFVDDFFTVVGGTGDMPLQAIDAAVFPKLSGPCEQTGRSNRVAYRVAIPPIYDPGNPVTMRLFVLRTGPGPDGCFVFRLDAKRLRDGFGVEVYGWPRWIRVDVPPGGAPGAAMFLVVDLPLNVGSAAAPTGLGFQMDPNGDLLAAHFIAFELNSDIGDGEFYEDGGNYCLLGVEFFESEAATVDGATIFFSKDDVHCGDLPPAAPQ